MKRMPLSTVIATGLTTLALDAQQPPSVQIQVHEASGKHWIHVQATKGAYVAVLKADNQSARLLYPDRMDNSRPKYKAITIQDTLDPTTVYRGGQSPGAFIFAIASLSPLNLQAGEAVARTPGEGAALEIAERVARAMLSGGQQYATQYAGYRAAAEQWIRCESYPGGAVVLSREGCPNGTKEGSGGRKKEKVEERPEPATTYPPVEEILIFNNRDRWYDRRTERRRRERPVIRIPGSKRSEGLPRIYSRPDREPTRAR